jgi:hypothetical protein
LEQTAKNITFPERWLDCVNYSKCLTKAVHQFLPRDDFSCARCKRYEQEKVSEVEIVREGMRALKLLRVMWRDEKRIVQHPIAFSIASL